MALTQRANAYVEAVADVEVNKSNGQVSVKRIVCSHDCGLIINPDGVRNQAEGNIIQGVSRALLEEVTFDSNAVTSLDWGTYPILRFPDVPELVIVLINRPEMARQRNLRRNRHPAARGTVHTEARIGGAAKDVIVPREAGSCPCCWENEDSQFQGLWFASQPRGNKDQNSDNDHVRRSRRRFYRYLFSL